MQMLSLLSREKHQLQNSIDLEPKPDSQMLESLYKIETKSRSKKMNNRCLKHVGALKVFFISDSEKHVSWDQIRPAGTLVLRCPAEAEGGTRGLQTSHMQASPARISQFIPISSHKKMLASYVSAHVIVLLGSGLCGRCLRSVSPAQIGMPDIWR